MLEMLLRKDAGGLIKETSRKRNGKGNMKARKGLFLLTHCIKMKDMRAQLKVFC